MAADEAPSVFRPGGVSYLRIPAPDPPASAEFYRAGDVVGPRQQGPRA